jgi:hypothetical protein
MLSERFFSNRPLYIGDINAKDKEEIKIAKRKGKPFSLLFPFKNIRRYFSAP